MRAEATTGSPAASGPLARADSSYEHPDKTPGKYEIVLEMWHYEGYKNKDHGKFVEISNKVTYTI